MKRLNDFMAAVQKLRDTIDRAAFDPATLLEELDYDAESIIAFVRDDITFELYPGLLRGPEGTLMSRAGNALDQAVLAAKLLKDAGYDAQVVEGRLDETQVDVLIRQIAKLPPQEDGTNYSRIRDALMEMASSLDLDKNELADVEALLGAKTKSGPEDDVHFLQQTTDLLVATLESAGIKLGDEAYLAKIREEASQYHWLRYRGGPGAPWRAVHPAFGLQDMDSLSQLAEQAFYADTIPEQLQHRVRLSISIEQQLGSSLTKHHVVPVWERPAANLHAVPIEFANMPTSVDDLDTLLTQKDWLNNPIFVPTVNGQLPRGGQAFDLNGNSFPLAESSTAQGAYFRTLNQAAESALGALTTKNKAEDVVALTRQWIEYSVISPSGEVTSEKRVLFDAEEWHGFDALLAQDGRSSSLNAYAAGLLGSVLIMVNTGRIPVEYQLDRLAEHTLAIRPALENLIEATLGNGSEKTWPASSGTSPLSLFEIFAAFDLPDQAANVYRSAPTIIAHEQRLRSGGTSEMPAFWSSVDIVQAPRRAFEANGSELSPAPKEVLARGVWESFAEGIHSFDAARPDRYTAFEDLRALQGSKTPYRVSVEIPNSSNRANTHTDRPTDRRSDGRIAIVPVAASAGESSWWRVDLETGTTHAIAPDGRGTAQTEYLLNLMKGYAMSVAACTVTMVAMNSIMNAFIRARMFQVPADEPTVPLLRPSELGLCLTVSAFPATRFAAAAPVPMVGRLPQSMMTFPGWAPAAKPATPVKPALVWAYTSVVGFLNAHVAPKSF